MKQEKYLNGSVCLLDGVRLDKKKWNQTRKIAATGQRFVDVGGLCGWNYREGVERIDEMRERGLRTAILIE